MDHKRSQKENLETNKNGNTTYGNIWDAGKPVQRGKFIEINAYIKRKRKKKLSKNLTL